MTRSISHSEASTALDCQAKRPYTKRGTPFWDRAEQVETGCIEWQGATVRGYGWYQRKYAHRVAYEITHGAIPDGLVICHRCDNRRCINPEHLFLGTQGDNLQDAASKGRTARQQGEDHGACKFTDEQVVEVRRLKTLGWRNIDIAQHLGISSSYVCRLAKGDRR